MSLSVIEIHNANITIFGEMSPLILINWLESLPEIELIVKYIVVSRKICGNRARMSKLFTKSWWDKSARPFYERSIVKLENQAKLAQLN